MVAVIVGSLFGCFDLISLLQDWSKPFIGKYYLPEAKRFKEAISNVKSETQVNLCA